MKVEKCRDEDMEKGTEIRGGESRADADETAFCATRTAGIPS